MSVCKIDEDGDRKVEGIISSGPEASELVSMADGIPIPIGIKHNPKKVNQFRAVGIWI